jgi:hypothetical protein
MVSLGCDVRVVLEMVRGWVAASRLQVGGGSLAQSMPPEDDLVHVVECIVLFGDP